MKQKTPPHLRKVNFIVRLNWPFNTPQGALWPSKFWCAFHAYFNVTLMLRFQIYAYPGLLEAIN